MDTPSSLPDFDAFATEFDRYLPLIEPVGLAVLDRLPVLPEGARVLDVACGTGEPGLTLARRSPDVHLLGVDAAGGMVDVARAKAARENIANAHFEVMKAESLGCASDSMDVVVSRFGLLMFGDVAAGACELARVLRPGGHFSLAVWDDPATNTLVGAVVAGLRPHVPAETVALFDRLKETAAGKRLHEAGVAEAKSESFRWNYEFENGEALWQFIAGPGMFSGHFARLEEAEKTQVGLEVAALLGAYRQADGSYRIPHACRLWWGRK